MLENCFPKNGEKVPKFQISGFTGDWEQRKLGDVAIITGGGTPSTNVPDIGMEILIGILQQKQVRIAMLVKSTRKITKLGQKKSSAKLLPIGTVLFTSRQVQVIQQFYKLKGVQIRGSIDYS